MEWYRTIYTPQSLNGFLTPQSRKLTDFQIQRRADITGSSPQHRAAVLHSKRKTPGRETVRNEKTTTEEGARAALRGPLVFPSIPQTEI